MVSRQGPRLGFGTRGRGFLALDSAAGGLYVGVCVCEACGFVCGVGELWGRAAAFVFFLCCLCCCGLANTARFQRAPGDAGLCGAGVLYAELLGVFERGCCYGVLGGPAACARAARLGGRGRERCVLARHPTFGGTSSAATGEKGLEHPACCGWLHSGRWQVRSCHLDVDARCGGRAGRVLLKKLVRGPCARVEATPVAIQFRWNCALASWQVSAACVARMCSWSRRCWKRCCMADKMAFGAALFGMSLRGFCPF